MGAFPSDTQKNLKDCMEIQLRSGKEVSNNNKKEKKEKTDEEEKETGRRLSKGFNYKKSYATNNSQGNKKFLGTCWFLQKIYQRLL